MKNLLLKSKFKVPIYNVDVWVIVAYDAVKALRRLSKKFAAYKIPKDEAFLALCVTDKKGNIGLFFHADLIDADSIGHEVIHAVEFTLDFIGSEVGLTDEVAASLTGYLHKRIHNLMRKHEITIHRK